MGELEKYLRDIDDDLVIFVSIEDDSDDDKWNDSPRT